MAALLRVPFSSMTSGDVVLDRDTARYVTRVHRLGVGDEFVAFDPEARVEANARLIEVGRRVRCVLDEIRTAEAVARTGVTLIQALGKGDKPDRVVREATALGVERVVFCLSRRTIPDPGERKPARLERLRAVAVEAARQSGRGDIPALEGFLAFDDCIGRASARSSRRLCLSPLASTPFAEALRGYRLGEPIAVLVGPEGGFDGREIDRAIAAGFVAVRFGRFVLRTETTAVAVLGALIGSE